MSEHRATARATALHRRLLDAAAACRASWHDLALLLAELDRDGLFRELGYASLRQYAVAELELGPRQASALRRIGRRLPALPALDAAFAEGRVGWTKARELVAVATPETDAEWVAVAEATSSRELEALVARATPGQPPPAEEGDDPWEDLTPPPRRRLVFEMEQEDAQLVADALALLRLRTGTSRDEVSDGALLVEMARRTVHDADPDTAPTGARHVVALQHCPTCRGFATLDGTHVGDTVAGAACCDADVVELRPGPRQGHRGAVVPPAVRRLVVLRDRRRCVVPWCDNRMYLDVHHIRPRHLGGTHEPENLCLTCSTHHGLVHDGRLAMRPLSGGVVEVETAAGRRGWVRLGHGPVPDPRGSGQPDAGAPAGPAAGRARARAAPPSPR